MEIISLSMEVFVGINRSCVVCWETYKKKTLQRSIQFVFEKGERWFM